MLAGLLLVTGFVCGGFSASGGAARINGGKTAAGMQPVHGCGGKQPAIRDTRRTVVWERIRTTIMRQRGTICLQLFLEWIPHSACVQGRDPENYRTVRI